MNNFEFLRRYERLQDTIMFDKFIDLGFAVVSYCGGDNSAFWNHALINQLVNEKQLEKIAEVMRQLERNPACILKIDKISTCLRRAGQLS